MDKEPINIDNGADDGLNVQQRAAASFAGRNLLLLAGAGTGKTRTIIARAKYLLEKGVSPSRMLILSFTRKSAREIVSRLQSSVSNDARQLRGQTFHSWCMSMIEQNPTVFNFGKFTVIDEEDRKSAFGLVCGKSFKKENFIKPEQLSEVYSYAVNSCCNLSTALRHCIFDGRMDDDTRERVIRKMPVYEKAIRAYLAFKASRRYLDYDDILQKVAVGLAKNPSAAEFMASAYDHILIDEMQDTNPLQYKLLSSFWTRCDIFCVGDDAQSIYGFRGADFKSIHRFTEVVPDAEVMKLTINYRSTQEILDMSNWLLARSPLSYDKMLTAARGNGRLPVLCHYSDEWDQARDIVMRIRNTIGEQGLRYRDNMVLSRSNRGLRPIEACLVEARIPYVIYGGSSLMASAHIRDVVSALRIVANPHDELAWTRYLLLFPRIGEITASRIIDRLADKDNLDECISVLADEKALDPSAAATLLSIARVRDAVSRAVEEAFAGLTKILEARYKDTWQRRKADIPLLKKIGEASESLTAFISEYILDPSLETADKAEGNSDDHVILTTIHSAKGLEASVCYIVNVSYSQYPSPHAIDCGEDEIEEERRCLYVAMTRAKDDLIIYRSHKAGYVEDGPSAQTASVRYFLNNIPDFLFQPEFLGDTRRSWSGYTGPALSFDDNDDFDFS